MRRVLSIALLLVCLTTATAAAATRTARAPAQAAAPAGASAFFIRGAGFGHGIGMSQYGALGYALHGRDYRAILGHYYQGTAIGQTNPGQIVRVLLKTGSAAFSGADLASPKQKLNPSLTYTVTAQADGTLVLLDPSGKKVGQPFAAPLVVNGPGPLQVAGLGAYRGALEFRPDASGGVQTVNAVDLEDYVRGVVSAEMPSSWAAQALEVQAVAARTYALFPSVQGNGYTLYPDTRSQMYRGVSAETSATDAAVAATRGQVVTYNGQPIVTYFSSSSGGRTENVENVWPGATPEPYLMSVSDPYDGAGGNPNHRWGVNLRLGAAGARLGSLVKGSLVGIRVLRRGVSPRIIQAEIVGTRGTTRVSGSQLESALGLKSTWATFTTITTVVGLPGRTTHAPRSPAATWTTWPPGQASVQSLLAALAHPAAHRSLGVHGMVFPGRRGSIIAVQQLTSHGWRSVKRLRLGRGGTYSQRLAHSGLYRVVWNHLAGPPVRVS